MLAGISYSRKEKFVPPKDHAVKRTTIILDEDEENT
jgi:hypothetical protein